jgi:hypothetical protein
MNKEEYDELYFKAVLKEQKHWSLLMYIKYMTAPTKILFGDEESARSVYEAFSEALNKSKDYSLNSSQRTFTFSSHGNASTTVDLSDISCITVNPPVNYLYSEEEND